MPITAFVSLFEFPPFVLPWLSAVSRSTNEVVTSPDVISSQGEPVLVWVYRAKEEAGCTGAESSTLLPIILDIILIDKALPHPLHDLRPETKFSSRGKSFGI